MKSILERQVTYKFNSSRFGNDDSLCIYVHNVTISIVDIDLDFGEFLYQEICFGKELTVFDVKRNFNSNNLVIV